MFCIWTSNPQNGLTQQDSKPLNDRSNINRSFNNLLLMALFIAGLLFLIIRAKYGFCFNDEAFCVTLGQRLYKGDALIAEEWHGCQFFSVIILPLYTVFKLFSSTNEGILLFLRYCYCLLWWLCIVYVSISIGKYPLKISLIFLYLLFFSPLDYMTVSYTSIGLISALLIVCILIKIPAESRIFSWGDVFAFSLFWAMLVLCSPFMILAYLVLLGIAVVGISVEKRKRKTVYFHNLLMIYRYALLIDIFLAIVYIYIFILSRADLHMVIESIPHILADPEHQSKGVLHSVLILLTAIVMESPFFVVASILAFLYGLFAKENKNRSLLIIFISILYMFSQFDAVTNVRALNVQMLHIVFLGAIAFSLLEKKNLKLFFCTYGFSICYSLLNGLASNTGIMAISMTATVAGCSAIVFLIQLATELLKQYRLNKLLCGFAAVLICGTLCVQISSEFFVKMTRQYWDKPLSQLTETISCGAAKGLRTTPETVEQYTNTYHSLTYMFSGVDTDGKQFLSCTSAPYIYLDADLDFATFSAWSFGYGNKLNDRILDYQSINPSKIPDIIYCASEVDILPLIDESYRQYEYNGQYLFIKK